MVCKITAGAGGGECLSCNWDAQSVKELKGNFKGLLVCQSFSVQKLDLNYDFYIGIILRYCP